MSEPDLLKKPSLRGYANLAELRTLFLAVLATNGVIGVLLQVAIDIASQHEAWLHTSWASAVMPLVVMALSAIQARLLSRQVLAAGR